MAKYPGWFTTEEVCESECEEAKAVLEKYNVSEDDVETIIGMIKQPYFMLKQSYDFMKSFGRTGVDE